MKLNRFFPGLSLLARSFMNGFCGEAFSVKNTPLHKDWVYKWGRKGRVSGCPSAVDVIHSLPRFDGENLAAWGYARVLEERRKK